MAARVIFKHVLVLVVYHREQGKSINAKFKIVKKNREVFRYISIEDGEKLRDHVLIHMYLQEDKYDSHMIQAMFNCCRILQNCKTMFCFLQEY